MVDVNKSACCCGSLIKLSVSFMIYLVQSHW